MKVKPVYDIRFIISVARVTGTIDFPKDLEIYKSIHRQGGNKNKSVFAKRIFLLESSWRLATRVSSDNVSNNKVYINKVSQKKGSSNKVSNSKVSSNKVSNNEVSSNKV